MISKTDFNMRLTRTIDIYQTVDVTIQSSGNAVSLPESLVTDRNAATLVGIQAVPAQGASIGLLNVTEFAQDLQINGQTIFERGFPLRLLTSDNAVEPAERFFPFNGCCGIELSCGTSESIKGALVNNGTVDAPYTIRLVLHYRTVKEGACVPRC